MKLGVHIAGKRWTIDAGASVELAIPLAFEGEQPRAFGLPPAQSKAVADGDFIGDTRRGGSANCETVQLTAHANGTHTEGVGHLTEERISVGDTVARPLLLATVLSAPIRRLAEVQESYGGSSEPTDRVLCARDLQQAQKACAADDFFLESLVIRCQSFDSHCDHSGTNPPYLTTQAVEWLRDIGCEHLLVELPSVDRESDGGTLPNHHLFFGIERHSRATEKSRRRTITELIAVPDEVRDGPYALSLRFARFESDAAPSRPILYPLRPVH